MSNSNDGYEWPSVAIKIMYVPIKTVVATKSMEKITRTCLLPVDHLDIRPDPSRTLGFSDTVEIDNDRVMDVTLLLMLRLQLFGWSLFTPK